MVKGCGFPENARPVIAVRAVPVYAQPAIRAGYLIYKARYLCAGGGIKLIPDAYH